MLPFAVQNAAKTLRLTRLPALGGPVTRTTTTTTTASIALHRGSYHPSNPPHELEQSRRRWSHSHTKWRPVQVLDEYVFLAKPPPRLRPQTNYVVAQQTRQIDRQTDRCSLYKKKLAALTRRVKNSWVAKEARPISLRQLMVFGRSLTEARLISSANYVRTELPTRIAHRLRDMQRLPYAVVSNPHIHDVYELYYDAFDLFRRVREVQTLDDNERFCAQLAQMLRAHLTVIPKLTMGMLECSGLMPADDLDRFMNTLLRSVSSRLL